MEAFTLLKYWKAGGGATDPFLPSSRAAAKTTILTATAASDNEEEDNDDFFDLEFAVPDAAPEEDSDAEGGVEEEEEEDDRTTVSPSESESLFFKGRLVVPVDDPASEPNSGPPPPAPPPAPAPAHQLPSLTKFRVFLLGLKKTKLGAQQKPEDDVPRNGKFFAVKFKVDEVPLVSLFSSSRKGTETTPVNEDRRFSKEGVQRYLKKVKPLYVKVSKLRSSISGAGAGDGQVVEKQVSLGKSRSGTSSAVSSPAVADLVAASGGVIAKRRDDSLFLQQDGIQGAILHCKKSFNASRDSGACLLPRSSSDTTSHEKLTELLSRKPADGHGGGK